MTRVVRNLPLNILTNNLFRIYELFKKYETEGYVQEVFKRCDLELVQSKHLNPTMET